MNDLLFTALCLALLYYFFYYLPQQKKVNANQPLSINKEVQTEITEEKIKLEDLKADIQQKERTIIGLNNSYQRLETKKAQEITNLKKQLESVNKEKKDDEKTLEQLLKEMQELSEILG